MGASKKEINSVVYEQLARTLHRTGRTGVKDSSGILPTHVLVDDLGSDSLDVLEIIIECEESFERSVTDEEVSEIRTVADLYTLFGAADE